MLYFTSEERKSKRNDKNHGPFRICICAQSQDEANCTLGGGQVKVLAWGSFKTCSFPFPKPFAWLL